MTDNYVSFLASKRTSVDLAGFDVKAEDINAAQFLFQRDITRWALKLGRAAIFSKVGTGKTFMHLEWARHVARVTGKPVLVLTPIAVAEPTVKEGAKRGITVKHVHEQSDVGDAQIVVTNYDRVHLFNVPTFGGVVLDESSILKHYTQTFFTLTELFANTPYRLCCTATPAPNDYVEFGNHAMFLGIMHFKDMLARWFVGEGDVAREARLKGHARTDFWRWLTSWAVCISKPSDLGDQYDMPGYDLPEMHLYEHRLGVNQIAIDKAWSLGRLLPDASPNATSFMRVKRDTLPERVEKVRELVAGIDSKEPIIIWCDTDFEADALQVAVPEAIEVRGSQSEKVKEDRLNDFTEGRTRIIITKPEIAGFGLNWQHCCHMIFAGVSFSFERWYQAIGRIHRYGQQREVHIHFVYSASEDSVTQILQDKQVAFSIMQAEMNAAMLKYGLFREGSVKTVYAEAKFEKEEGQGWTYYLGDCVPITRGLPDNSVHLTVSSIPFGNLYIYSDAAADVGNSKDKEEFFGHMEYLIAELLRVTVPGRCCAIHVKDLPLFQNRDGAMGVDPFSDDVSTAFRKGGWVLQSRVTVEKDPVIEMQKTNSHGLLFKNWRERAEILRVGLPDYVLVFVKPGAAPESVKHDPTDTTYYGSNPIASYRFPNLPARGTGVMNTALPIWQEYANPNWSDVVVPLVWTDIVQTNTLNYFVAKDNKDERHICPLQLDLIGRLIHWKSNPGDLVMDPFGGIASTGVKALEMKRRFVGMELKPSYHKLGVKYLRQTEITASAPTLFDLLDLVEGR